MSVLTVKGYKPHLFILEGLFLPIIQVIQTRNKHVVKR